jgi:hypothetical protein
VDRDPHAGGGDGGVVVAQHIGHARVAGVAGADRLAAARAGEGQPQRVVAEARHAQRGGVEAFVPGQRQRPDAAAEALAEIAQARCRLGHELEQRGGGAPHVGGAVAVDVRLPRCDAVQHVPLGPVRHAPVPAAGREAVQARPDGGGARRREPGLGGAAAAVAVGGDAAGGDVAVGRHRQPAADAPAAGRGVRDVVHLDGPFPPLERAERGRHPHVAGGVVPGPPEGVEVLRRRGRFDRKEPRQIVPVARVEGEAVPRR